jgi:hypothetical protein
VYTSGKGSSAAGLTAAVVQDASSREFFLEVSLGLGSWRVVLASLHGAPCVVQCNMQLAVHEKQMLLLGSSRVLETHRPGVVLGARCMVAEVYRGYSCFCPACPAVICA